MSTLRGGGGGGGLWFGLVFVFVFVFCRLVSVSTCAVISFLRLGVVFDFGLCYCSVIWRVCMLLALSPMLPVANSLVWSTFGF